MREQELFFLPALRGAMQFTMARLALLAGLASILAEASAVESRSTVSPVQKVIQMLQGMLVKGKEEKHAEEVQFATYQQFCTDVIETKTRDIKVYGDATELLTANVQTAQTAAETLQREMNELDNEVATWQANIKATTGVREVERSDYTAAHQDYSETVDAITRAVQVLKAQDFSRAQAPVQAAMLQKLGKDTTMEVAKREIAAFLARGQQDPLDDNSPDAYAYEFRSTSVVDMLNSLKDKFIQERSDLEKAELNKRHAFELELQDLQRSITNAQAERAAKVQQKAHQLQAVSQLQAGLQDITSTRADDNKFLTETRATCEQKSADFTERQQLRADEIAAIGQAIEILSGDKVLGTSNQYLAFLAQSRKAKKGMVLAQLRSVQQNPNQLAVATYLSDQAQRIHSRVLNALAVHARDDPFSKVKQMIMDLINRLMAEAGEEAQQKQFCDAELVQNEQQRTSRSADVDRYQSSIDEAQATIARLANEIAEHTQSMAHTDGEVGELTKIRQQEKAENEKTIRDAREAQTAVGQAVTVLREFYSRAGQATALLQGKQDQQPTAPEIFDGAYKGQADSSGGVLSMLEVIQSDYARLESTSSAMEATAQQEFDRQMSESAVLRAQTQRDIEHKMSQRQTAQQSVVDLNSDLTSARRELETANNYYEKLKPQCLDAGVSFEDRAQRRQEEIQSLQEALRILNGEDIGAAPR